MSIYVGDKEIKNLYIGESTSISDMQGPCPAGFHVPLNTEWEGLKDLMDGIGLTSGDDWRINLHMPFAGEREYGDAELSNQGGEGVYWTSSSSDDTGFRGAARVFALDESNVGIVEQGVRAYGSSIRGFKDSFEEPTSSWMIIQGDLGGAGIFGNQSEGLISITDGSTGYTIMDKNLGATTVYNDGDTLTEANMGNMYQWGNNYGFPSTGSVSKTSSIQVDASTYGPGNYYSSDTFIITNNRDWSSVQNENLRGGVSQGIVETTGIKAVYLGDIKVWPGLLTYEQIVAMANTEGYPWTNTIAELNNNPTEYYNMLSQGNHMSFIGYRGTSVDYPVIADVGYDPTPTQFYRIYYINDLFVCDYNTGGGD